MSGSYNNKIPFCLIDSYNILFQSVHIRASVWGGVKQ